MTPLQTSEPMTPMPGRSSAPMNLSNTSGQENLQGDGGGSGGGGSASTSRCDQTAITNARRQAFFRVQNVHFQLAGVHPTLGYQQQQHAMREARRLVSPRIRNVTAVQDLISNMMTVLSSDRVIECGPEIDNCSVWNGYVQGNRVPIHLCDSFFDLDFEGQVRTLIHESAHAAGIGDPGSELYLPIFDCDSNANDYNSADAWAHYVHCLSGQAADQPETVEGN